MERPSAEAETPTKPEEGRLPASRRRTCNGRQRQVTVGDLLDDVPARALPPSEDLGRLRDAEFILAEQTL